MTGLERVGEQGIQKQENTPTPWYWFLSRLALSLTYWVYFVIEGRQSNQSGCWKGKRVKNYVWEIVWAKHNHGCALLPCDRHKENLLSPYLSCLSRLSVCVWNFLCKTKKGVSSVAGDRCVRAWDDLKLSRGFLKCHWEVLLRGHTQRFLFFFLSEVLNNGAVLSRMSQLGPVGLGKRTSVCVCVSVCIHMWMHTNGLSLSHRQTAELYVRILSDICLPATARHKYTQTHITWQQGKSNRMERKCESL